MHSADFVSNTSQIQLSWGYSWQAESSSSDSVAVPTQGGGLLLCGYVIRRGNFTTGNVRRKRKSDGTLRKDGEDPLFLGVGAQDDLFSRFSGALLYSLRPHPPYEYSTLCIFFPFFFLLLLLSHLTLYFFLITFLSFLFPFCAVDSDGENRWSGGNEWQQFKDRQVR